MVSKKGRQGRIRERSLRKTCPPLPTPQYGIGTFFYKSPLIKRLGIASKRIGTPFIIHSPSTTHLLRLLIRLLTIDFDQMAQVKSPGRHRRAIMHYPPDQAPYLPLRQRRRPNCHHNLVIQPAQRLLLLSFTLHHTSLAAVQTFYTTVLLTGCLLFFRVYRPGQCRLLLREARGVLPRFLRFSRQASCVS